MPLEATHCRMDNSRLCAAIRGMASGRTPSSASEAWRRRPIAFCDCARLPALMATASRDGRARQARSSPVAKSVAGSEALGKCTAGRTQDLFERRSVLSREPR